MLKLQKDGYFRETFYFNSKQYSARGKTEKEAIKKAHEKKKALERGDIGISNNMTVRSWAYEWLDTFKKGTIVDKSYKRYKAHIDNVILPVIGNMRIRDVRDVHLQKILNLRKGYSKSDTKKILFTIQAMFKQARLSRLIQYDPAEGTLKMPLTTQGKRRSLTDIERVMILNTAETHHAGLWIKTMLFCGIRPGEVMALLWKDIDFKQKMVIIDKAIESGSDNVKEPKTEAGKRSIPIPDVLLNELKAVKGEPFAPVFTQLTNSKRHTESSLRKAWVSFIKAMDIENGAQVQRNKVILSVVSPDLIPYYLRHTYCTDLEAAGVPINIAKVLMGHSNIGVTSKIYTHTTSKAIADAAEKINLNLTQKVS